MPFPHPKAAQHNEWEKYVSNKHYGFWNLRNGTINVSDNRNACDNMQPAEKFAFGRGFHGRCLVEDLDCLNREMVSLVAVCKMQLASRDV